MSDADIVEIAEQHGFIFSAITLTWGPRCPDFERGCWCCKAWAEYDTIAALTARVAELEGALTRMIDLCTLGANPGAFDNGNLDSTGGVDEGDFIAGRIIDEARAAITQETA